MNKVFPKESLRTPKEVHKMSLKELQDHFDVDIAIGISSARADEINKLNARLKKGLSYKSIYKEILYGLTDRFSIIQWISILLFVVLYEPLGGNFPDISNLVNIVIIILCFIAKSAMIGVQEYKSLKMIKAMCSNDMTLVSVLRDSTWQKIPAFELVIGDVVEISANERVPADLRFIMAQNLYLDKSILTGESEPIEACVNDFENIESSINYQEARNIALAHFLVLSGVGRGIVISSGRRRNHVGKYVMKKKNHDNPIYRGLDKLALYVFLIAIISIFIYLIIWISFLRLNYYSSTKHVLINVLNIVVNGIPVGLPVSLLAGFLIIIKKMRKCDILIKNIFAFKSMNSIDVVLTDKTGTLTRNSVEIANVFYSTKEINADLCYQSPDIYLGAQNGLKELLDLCDFCSREDVVSSYNYNLVEQVLLSFAIKNKPSTKKLRKEFDIIEEIEFNSSNKFQVRLIKARNDPPRNILMIRGAPDYLIPKCKYVIKPDGGYERMGEESLRTIESKLNQWSMMGRRLICFCKKILSGEQLDMIEKKHKNDFYKWFDLESRDFIFVGMIGFIDPPKPEINESIAKIRRMGVRVVMITGDYSITAVSIAKQVGILSNPNYDTYSKFRECISSRRSHKNSLVLNGFEIEKVSKEEWKAICTEYNEIILSRANPNHKLLCVKEFQANGHSVLMVGDGVNDVPALRRADLSVAMNSGCKLASDVSSVVLLNNSFSSIYDLLSIVRQAFVNNKKIFLYSIISSVFSQSTVTLLSTVLCIPQLYTNLQMTIVSGFTDVITSISFMFEKPEPRELIMSKEKFLDARLLFMGFFILGPLTTFLAYLNFFSYIVWHANIPLSAIIFKYFTNSDTSEEVQIAQSIGFYSIVIMHCFGNLYSIRTRRLLFIDSLPFARPYTNWYLIVSSASMFVMIALITTFPIYGLTVRIPFIFYFTPIGCSLLVFVLNEIRKICLNRFALDKTYFSW